MDVTDAFAWLAEKAGSCTRCTLSQTRTNVVFGDGSPTADLMFVGEAPGQKEDEQGIPFVGRSGQLLNKLATEVGITRSEIYIANVLKCRPPANRNPLPEEIQACTPFLDRQIRFIKPAVIVPLGNFATKYLLEEKQGITRLRGQCFPWRGAVVIPTFHPSAAIRPGGGARLADMRRDFALIRRTIDAARHRTKEQSDSYLRDAHGESLLASPHDQSEMTRDKEAVSLSGETNASEPMASSLSPVVTPVDVDLTVPTAPDTPVEASRHAGQLGLF